MLFRINKRGEISKKRAGSFDKTLGHRCITVTYKTYREHRIIYILMKGEIPIGYDIDHKDNDETNNLIDNLRACTRSENAQNKSSSNGSTGYKGVMRYTLKDNTYKWSYFIYIKGKKSKCKYGFNSPLEAYEARCKVLCSMHGEFANPGKPQNRQNENIFVHHAL